MGLSESDLDSITRKDGLTFFHIRYQGSGYLLINKNNNMLKDNLWREPLGFFGEFILFPEEPRDTKFYFKIWSSTYGYIELGPFDSYADAQVKIHEFKGRAMRMNDGVHRYYSDPYSKELTQDPILEN